MGSQLPIGLETILLGLSAVTYLVNIIAWVWIRRLRARLSGGAAELVGIITFLLGWSLLLRILPFLALAYYAVSHDIDMVTTLTVATQIIYLILIGEVWRRMRAFMISR